MTDLKVENLVKKFGGLTAVNAISFNCEGNRIVTLLGPSGCGKTTTLRCIAGLEKPESGKIIIGDEVVTSAKEDIWVPPEKRGIGMVFQSYAIWPHMNVFDNVAYGLQAKRVAKDQIEKKVHDVLKIVGLENFEKRMSTKLSGGQQQRVALARALVYNPRILLFDEPLSNLDAKLREKMRIEIVRVQREVGITSVYVTHDQSEALTISDQIIIINNGRVEQIGTAKEIYDKPANKFVADFIGTANFMEGKVVKEPDPSGAGWIEISDGINTHEIQCYLSSRVNKGDNILISIRPESIDVFKHQPQERINVIEGKVKHVIYLGSQTDLSVLVGEKEIRARTDPKMPVDENESLFLQFKPEDCLVIPSETN